MVLVDAAGMQMKSKLFTSNICDSFVLNRLFFVTASGLDNFKTTTKEMFASACFFLKNEPNRKSQPRYELQENGHYSTRVPTQALIVCSAVSGKLLC